MIRAGLADHTVFRRTLATRLQKLLERGLAVGFGHALAGFFQRLLKKRMAQNFARGRQAGIQINGSEHGFESVRQQSLLFASAGFFFTAAEAEVSTQLQASRSRFKRSRIYEACTAFRELPFSPIRKSLQEVFTGEQFEYSIAEKFKAFVIYRGSRVIRVGLTGAHFGDCRAMRQRVAQQRRAGKFVAQALFQKRVIRGSHLTHKPAIRIRRYFGALSWVAPSFLDSSAPSLHVSCMAPGVAEHLL